LEDLQQAYAAARVHVLANWSETCGLVSMEAALAGCSIVCSSAGYEREFFRDKAYYCDPTDLDSLRAAVVQAFNNYDQNAGRRQELRELIVNEYNHRRIAEKTLDVYRRVVADGRSRPPGGMG
jgi:glycosyltransferase involved in cell wall biosynthesis